MFVHQERELVSRLYCDLRCRGVRAARVAQQWTPNSEGIDIMATKKAVKKAATKTPAAKKPTTKATPSPKKKAAAKKPAAKKATK